MNVLGRTSRGRRRAAAITMMLAMSAALATASAVLAHSSQKEAERYKIALSLTYVGNDWQSEAQNGFLAESKTPPYDKRVETKVFVAGADVQKHITQLQQMIAQGYDAIVTYPVNPQALQPVIRQACARNVLLISYSSGLPLICPTAYQINTDEAFAGRATAQWLVNKLKGKGNIVLGTGVPGTTADTLRTGSAKKVFAKYPGIKIVGSFNTMWDQAVAQKGMAGILAAQQNVDGVWAQVGFGIVKSFLDANRKLVPITGEAENGFRLQLIDPKLKAQGLSGISYGNPPLTAAYGLKAAVAILDGQKIPHKMVLPLPLNNSDQLKLCSAFNPKKPPVGNCNVYSKDVVSTGFFADFYDKALVPELCLYAFQTGKPCPGQRAKPATASQWKKLPAGATSRA